MRYYIKRSSGVEEQHIKKKARHPSQGLSHIVDLVFKVKDIFIFIFMTFLLVTFLFWLL